MDKLFLTRKQAAEFLNLSTRSVDHLIAEGRLPSRKFGKRRLILRKDIERLARNGCDRIVPTLGQVPRAKHS